MTDTERQIGVIRRILSASDEQIQNMDFWMQVVDEYGIYPFQWLTELHPDSNYTENGMMQVRGEIANFCRFLSGQEIHTAIEIGVWRGRSSYFVCSVIYRKNKDLIYDMVDIVDGLDDYDKFLEVLPCMRKQIPHTSDDFRGQEYDYVFIDADHSYVASMLDYNNVGQYARKLTCFHDIYAHEYDAEGGGSVRTWEEVCVMTPQLPKLVFSQFPNRWMGIGVVVNAGKRKQTICENVLYEKMQKQLKLLKDDLNDANRIYIYGCRNDSRRMYEALHRNGYQVNSLLLHDESEYCERMETYPMSFLGNTLLEKRDVIVLNYRESLLEGAMQYLRELQDVKVIVVSDKLATFM